MRPRSFAGYLRSDRGAVAIMTGILFPVLVGGMALGAEAGYWYMSQRKLQHASDLAVYAAAVQLRSGQNLAAMTEAAEAVAIETELRVDDDLITVAHPPTTGALTGDDMAVEVTVNREQKRFFSLIYGSEDVPISARAVAVVTAGGNACILSLDPSASGAITVAGSTTATFDGCDAAVNSVAEDAFDMVGGAADFTTGCIQSAGGIDDNGNLNLTECSAPRVQAPTIPDPYADLAPPDVTGACSDGSIGQNNQMTTVIPFDSPTQATPSLRFCGGLNVRGITTFQPGLYIVDGGEFRINSNASISGSGVTFYLTNGAEIAFNGTATLDLSAPTSGDFSGILIFADRDDVGGQHTINGNNGSQLSGAIYTPTSDISYSGNFSGPNGCTQVVSRRITFTGNSSITVDCEAAGVRRIPTGEIIVLAE